MTAMGTLAEHPAYRQLQKRKADLSQELFLLLEEWCWITQTLNPTLRKQYETLFGDLEITLHRLAYEYEQMQQLARLLRQRVERGEPVTPSLIAQLTKIVCCRRLPSSTPLAPTTPSPTAELRHLYRKLVKRLHPDLQGETSSEYQKYWHIVQSAYRDRNLALLRAVDELLTSAIENNSPSSLQELQREIATLECRIAYQRRKLEQLKQDVPYQWKDCLDDPHWQDQHRRCLEAEIADLDHKLSVLQQSLWQWIEMLSQCPATVIRSYWEQEFQQQFVQQTYWNNR